MTDKKIPALLPFSVVKIHTQQANTFLFTSLLSSTQDTIGPDECFCTVCAVDENGDFLRVLMRHAIPIAEIIDVTPHDDVSPKDNNVIVAAVSQLKQLACA